MNSTHTTKFSASSALFSTYQLSWSYSCCINVLCSFFPTRRTLWLKQIFQLLQFCHPYWISFYDQECILSKIQMLQHNVCLCNASLCSSVVPDRTLESAKSTFYREHPSVLYGTSIKCIFSQMNSQMHHHIKEGWWIYQLKLAQDFYYVRLKTRYSSSI